MPLLKKKTLEKAPMPEFLRDDEEVFHCEMTNEIFRDYDEFAERTILCNSMVWTCSMTGKSNLTYEEAQSSEENAKRMLEDFPTELKIPMLFIANLTKRTSFGDMADDVYLYIKDRFFLGEFVEACFAVNKWKEYQVVQVIGPTEEVIKEKAASVRNENEFNSTIISPLLYKYDLEQLNSEDKDIVEKMIVDVTQIRRKKSLYSKDKSKLFLKQYVAQNSDGEFVIKPEALKSFSINDMSFSKIFDGPLPNFGKSKKKPHVKKVRQETLAKFLTKNNIIDNVSLKNTSAADTMKKLEDQKKMEELKLEKKKLEEELKLEKKMKLKQKNLEIASKVKEWYQMKDDLLLEDQKILPEPAPLKSSIPEKFIGDTLCILEFVNNFASVLRIQKYFGPGLTLDDMEKALLEKKIGGPLIDIFTMFLDAIFTFQEDEEKNYKMEVEYCTKKEYKDLIETKEFGYEEAIKLATVASKWSKKYQGLGLKNLSFCPVTISEILRLHLLSSGARLIDSHSSRMRSLCRGGYTSEDDPAIEFRLHNSHILKALSIHNVVELSICDKLKLLDCLVNQLLTYKQVRDVVDEKIDRVKDMKQNVKQIQMNEKKRQQEADSEMSKLDKKGSNEKTNGSKEEVKQMVDSKSDRKERITRENRSMKDSAEAQIDKLTRGILDCTTLLGYDRAFRRYLKLSSVPGLFVNAEDPNVGVCLSEPIINVPELANSDRTVVLQYLRKMSEEMNSSDKENEPKETPITVNGHSGPPIPTINDLHMCSSDPTTCVVHSTNATPHLWSVYKDQTGLEELIGSLNKRGVREVDLQNNLRNGFDVLAELIQDMPSSVYCEEMETDTESDIEKKSKAQENLGYADDLSSSEVLCAALIDSILEFEEKLHKNALGGFHKTYRDNFISYLEDKQLEQLSAELDSVESIKDKPKEENSDNVSETSDEVEGEEYKDPLQYVDINMADLESEDSETDSNDIVLMQSKAEKDQILTLARTLLHLAHSIKPLCLYLPVGTVMKKKHIGVRNSVMKNWEQSLLNATNYGQLFIHHGTLKSCVVWAKAVGHSVCMSCKKKTNGNLLVLCDHCNVGIHTFCMKPALKEVPEEEWHCPSCSEEIKQNEAHEEDDLGEETFSYDPEQNPKNCTTCGDQESGDVVRCNYCPLVYHLECVVPVIRRVPRGKYKCTSCKTEEKVENMKSTRLIQKLHDDSLRRSNRVRDEAKNGMPLHNAALQELLVEVMKHEDAWPFITPVQKREVPDYYDVISHPMDFGTIKYKLNMGDYKYDEELMSDVRLVFENCNTYNSSKDEVYKCGARLLKYVMNQAKEANLKTRVLLDVDLIQEDDKDEAPKSKRIRIE